MKKGKTFEEKLYECLGVSLLSKLSLKKPMGDLKSKKKRFINKAIIYSIPLLLMMLSAPAPMLSIGIFKTATTIFSLYGIALQKYNWLKAKREDSLLQKSKKKEEVRPAAKVKEEEPKTNNSKALELTKENKSDQKESQKKEVTIPVKTTPEKPLNTSEVLENLKSLRDEFRASINSDFEEQTSNFSRTLSNK